MIFINLVACNLTSSGGNIRLHEKTVPCFSIDIVYFFFVESAKIPWDSHQQLERPFQPVPEPGQYC